MIPSLEVAGWHVSTYNVMLSLYLPLAILLTVRIADCQGIDARAIVKLGMIAVPAGIIGARLLDAIEYPSAYSTFRDLVGRQGSSIYGAFLALGAVVLLVAPRMGLSPLQVLDAGAPAIALGEVMTRIACFLNGCCYGRPSGALGVTFPPESFAYADQQVRGWLPAGAPHSLPVHPVQLYSSALMCGVFVLLCQRSRRTAPVGTAISTFLVAYGALRLGMAPLRAEALLSMKAFSILFVVAGLGGLWQARERLAMAVPARP
jgi:phosphatidylglycerol:prolipoprotein diacylglycerol transferase